MEHKREPVETETHDQDRTASVARRALQVYLDMDNNSLSNLLAQFIYLMQQIPKMTYVGNKKMLAGMKYNTEDYQ